MKFFSQLPEHGREEGRLDLCGYSTCSTGRMGGRWVSKEGFKWWTKRNGREYQKGWAEECHLGAHQSQGEREYVCVCVWVRERERLCVHAWMRAVMHILLGKMSAAVKQEEEKSKKKRRGSRVRSSHIGRNHVHVFESSLSQCWGILP